MQLVCTKRLPGGGSLDHSIPYFPQYAQRAAAEYPCFFARCCRCQPEALHGKSCAFIIRAEQPKREGKAGAAGCFILCKLESEPKTGAEERGLRAAVGLRDVSQPRVLGARTGGGDARTLICPPGREKPARTDWRIVSLHPECDTEDLAPSALEPELPRSHFAQYAVMHERYPSVKILLSIGGWTRCGYFPRWRIQRRAAQALLPAALRFCAGMGHAYAGGFIGAFADARLAQRL